METRATLIEPGVWRVEVASASEDIKCFDAPPQVEALFNRLLNAGYSVKYINRRVFYPKYLNELVFCAGTDGTLMVECPKLGFIRDRLSLEDAEDLVHERMIERGERFDAKV